MTATRKPATVKTFAELARRLGVRRETASGWQHQPGFPRNADGTFPVAKVAAWAKAMRSSAASRAPTKPQRTVAVNEQIAEDELARRREQTRKLRLQNEVLEGRLIAREVVAQEWSKRWAELRQNLLIVARRIAPHDPELRQRIHEEHVKLLEAYARPME